MVSKRRTRRRRNRQLKGGMDWLREFADTLDNTKHRLNQSVAKGAADIKGKVKQAAEDFGEAADGFGAGVRDAKRKAEAVANKAAEDAGREVHEAVSRAREKVDNDAESLHASLPQYGGRKRRKTKRRKTKRRKTKKRKTKKRTKRRKKRKSRRRRRK